MLNQLKIGELDECTRCLVETICYYERKGLLPAPARS
ncbi:MAG: MerR family DNA-binding transcriptional regulator [Candidimonas sp.]|nr:MAG: MerR family DNA-binding transcriptional regulator [Candidimonas sp.]TAM25053.1 MAG: MerR family DNA-binding transcriptional regulator [Candidimonas sp.]